MRPLIRTYACGILFGIVGFSGVIDPAFGQDGQAIGNDMLAMEDFELLVDAAMLSENPVMYDEALTLILDRHDLTSFMRGRVLFERGTRRWKDGQNKLGAIADFDAIVALDPTHPFAANAMIEKGFAETEIGHIEAGMNELQTITEWFDGAFSIGNHDNAVARYRESGLSPTPEQVGVMKMFGYVCDDLPGAPKLHHFGPERADLLNVHWCGAAVNMPGPDIGNKAMAANAPIIQADKNASVAKSESKTAIVVSGP